MPYSLFYSVQLTLSAENNNDSSNMVIRWLDGARHYIDGAQKKVFLFPKCFVTPFYYNKLMGMDVDSRDHQDDFNKYS